MHQDPERAAGVPEPIEPSRFNPKAALPYGLTINHIRAAMSEFVAFLGLINQTLYAKGLQRLETMLMPANWIYEASATGVARATARGPRRESSEPPASG